MKKASETVVFFGSGPVAAQSLELLQQHFTVEAVITKPRAAHHRGSVPVLELAQKLQLPTFTPGSRAELSKLFEQKPVQSTVGIVIDYGIIINQDVIDYFPFGIVNSHFSLLPQLRGADPITFSILSGQKQTGVSLMLIVQKMDEGPLLAQATYDMPPKITTPELTNGLISLSDTMLQEVLPLYLESKALPAPQDEVSIADDKTPTYSRKLTKEDGVIDWNKSANELEREIRAFIDWPKSRTTIANREVIITEASVYEEPVSSKPGTTLVQNQQLIIVCGQQALSLQKLKPVGKSEMTAASFLAGYRQFLT